MYLNTVFKLFNGGLRDCVLPLPAAVTLSSEQVLITPLKDRLPDTHQLTIKLKHDPRSLLAKLSRMAERVGGHINDCQVEFNLTNASYRVGELTLAFLLLEASPPLLSEGINKVELDNI